MKTRQEMIYDFMVALAGNSNTYDLIHSDMEDIPDLEASEAIYGIAASLADEYLKGLA